MFIVKKHHVRIWNPGLFSNRIEMLCFCRRVYFMYRKSIVRIHHLKYLHSLRWRIRSRSSRHRDSLLLSPGQNPLYIGEEPYVPSTFVIYLPVLNAVWRASSVYIGATSVPKSEIKIKDDELNILHFILSYVKVLWVDLMNSQ